MLVAMSEPGEPNEYVLGVNDAEVERLRFQHIAWVERAYALWRRVGFGAGQRLLDAGCGPGFTSFELARVVGPTGRVVARDQSAAFLEHLVCERDRLGLAWIEPSHGPVEELDLEPASLDGAYARWLFSWMPDPGAALARVAACVRPGGLVVLQEYLDWAAMKLVPPSAAFDRGVAICMRSWAEAGGHIDVAGILPALAEDAGLAVESFRPVARAGPVGSLEWRWPTAFLPGYLAQLVARGLGTPEELEAFRAALDERERTHEGFLVAPLMADVVLRRR